MTYQLVGLINCKNAATEAVLQIYVELGQQRDELFALVLHAGERNGYLVIVQVLRQDGKEAGLHHGRHHLTVLQGAEEVTRKKRRKGLNSNPFVPSLRRQKKKITANEKKAFHLLQSSPLAKHQGHCDALQGRLGVEVEEQQLP